jgi:hypothetical protein
MKKFVVAFGSLFLLAMSAISFGQARDPDAAEAVRSGVPSMTRVAPRPVDLSQRAPLTVSSGTVFDAKTGRVVGEGRSTQGGTKAESLIIDTGAGTIDGLVSVDTFDGAFAGQNGPSAGQLFRFSMMGNHPLAGGETLIAAPIDEVSLQLLNADGSTFMNVPFAPFEHHTLNSPNFREHNYASGNNIQYADAQMRAQFFNKMGPDWHTKLLPSVVNRDTIVVPRFVNVQLPNGKIIQARAYFTGTAADGNTFVLMLDLLFNFFFGNGVNNDINNGVFNTDSFNMVLFPNTYLFSLDVNHPNKPGPCCVLGFHTYFFNPGQVPQPRWITQFASWISPGIFNGGFEDVTALSHETSEAFNDPFVDNATPNWQFPDAPAKAKVCQNNLEVGDPIEVLSNATTKVTIDGFTYHPQNLVLLQWFEMGTTSNAINGTWSFPDPVLTQSALPCPQ